MSQESRIPQPQREEQLREGGWLKAVTPPTVASRPAGLPPVKPTTPAPANTTASSEE